MSVTVDRFTTCITCNLKQTVALIRTTTAKSRNKDYRLTSNIYQLKDVTTKALLPYANSQLAYKKYQADKHSQQCQSLLPPAPHPHPFFFFFFAPPPPLDLVWYMDMSPVHLVWPKPSCKTQWKGEEDKADRGRGGKTTSENGQAWSSPNSRPQWRTGKKGENWLRNHLWCPNDPHSLKGRRWWW